jgi:hypothetical protein
MKQTPIERCRKNLNPEQLIAFDSLSPETRLYTVNCSES